MRTPPFIGENFFRTFYLQRKLSTLLLPHVTSHVNGVNINVFEKLYVTLSAEPTRDSMMVIHEWHENNEV